MKNQENKNVPEIVKKQSTSSTVNLVNSLKKGDIAALGRAITFVESSREDHREQANIIVENCMSIKKDSIRIGITGVPGVGKSTFIETLGKLLIANGNRVAILAVDPTSTQGKGSILGDKTRMEDLVKNINAFIRPSPSGDTLGGVASKTRETIVLCEAAGYNIILVETVGVGQSETAVHGMVDFFLLLKLSGAGDELQGIKKGIVEIADAIVVNKADGDNIERAKIAAEAFKRALHLHPPKKNGWIPKVLTCSASENIGINTIWNMILQYIQNNKKSGHFLEKRKQQNKNWLYEAIEERLKSAFFKNQVIALELEKYITKVTDESISPFYAAEQLVGMFKNKD